jgi:hypothetical protein
VSSVGTPVYHGENTRHQDADSTAVQSRREDEEQRKLKDFDRVSDEEELVFAEGARHENTQSNEDEEDNEQEEDSSTNAR